MRIACLTVSAYLQIRALQGRGDQALFWQVFHPNSFYSTLNLSKQQMNKIEFCATLLAAMLAISPPSFANISVRDDSGALVTVKTPAQRVISLAPHVTELLFAAGGGKHIVGVVAYSDFPAAAKTIPQVGDNRQWDMERIIAMRPDLLVVWQHGNSEQQIEALRKLGVPMFYSEPKKLSDLADSVEKLGQLMGTSQEAQAQASAMRSQLQNLRQQYATRAPVRLFYQVWDKPLYTLNGKHIVSDAMHICGGENVFAALAITAPNVSIEAVLKENPEVIISGEKNNQAGDGLAMWHGYKSLLATQRGNLLPINGDLLSRSGPRMLQGSKMLCELLDVARQKRVKK